MRFGQEGREETAAGSVLCSHSQKLDLAHPLTLIVPAVTRHIQQGRGLERPLFSWAGGQARWAFVVERRTRLGAGQAPTGACHAPVEALSAAGRAF